MKGFFKDFKAFITKGNVLDLAVGVIIGAAFNAIVKSLVNDILMPIIGLVFQGDVSTKFLSLNGIGADIVEGKIVPRDGAILMYWGQFLQSIIDFLIIGLTLFIIIRIVAKLNNIREEKRAEILRKIKGGEELDEEEEELEEEVVEVPEEVQLLREIRDSLKKEEK